MEDKKNNDMNIGEFSAFSAKRRTNSGRINFDLNEEPPPSPIHIMLPSSHSQVSADGCHMAMGGFIDLEEPNHEFSFSTKGDATGDINEYSDAKLVKDATIDVGNNKGKGKMPMYCSESPIRVREKDANVNEVSNNPPLSTDGGNFKTLSSFEVEVVPDPSFTPASQNGNDEDNGVTEGNISLQEENVVVDVAAVQLESRMDIPDDGYRWRKYGRQKIKGGYLRSYYMCSNNGCSVRKQVERDLSNSGCVIKTTYDGRHNHEVPISGVRIINPPKIKPRPRTIREEIEAANAMVTFAIPPETTARLPRPTPPPLHPAGNNCHGGGLNPNNRYGNNTPPQGGSTS
ncbi:WRKY domain [Sesbania bispinosa]|nr:WRKY domain [Sesbania bispinosa]